jgi:hypothetical protein
MPAVLLTKAILPALSKNVRDFCQALIRSSDRLMGAMVNLVLFYGNAAR